MLHTSPVSAPSRACPPARPGELFGALPQPLLVLLPSGRLLFSNPSADQLLANGAELQAGSLTRFGQLDAAQLRELLALAAAGSPSRTGLWFTPALATGWLHAAPLAPAIAQACDWPLPSVLLAVHLDQPALAQAARIDALTRQYGLSRAERHVLLLLADGEPAEATSRHLGLRLSTVRSHVRSLLGKTQAPSLMQLLRWTGSAQALPN